MVNGALSGQIQALVDSLRQKSAASIALSEVAAVTEVLIKTMQLYFRSVDLRIYEECQSLSDYIFNARREIAALQPENPAGSRIPRAGKELDAIVKQTEAATNTIMEAAEEIMAIESDDLSSYREQVQGATMRIFEACSFQDITGQRISKVVETLQYIEQRANELKNILNVDDSDAPPPAPEQDEEKALLSGPALEGEGIDQAEVDALLEAEAVAPLPASSAPLDGTGTARPKPSAAPVTGKSARTRGPGNGDVEPLEVHADAEGRTTQSEIDALFN